MNNICNTPRKQGYIDPDIKQLVERFLAHDFTYPDPNNPGTSQCLLQGIYGFGVMPFVDLIFKTALPEPKSHQIHLFARIKASSPKLLNNLLSSKLTAPLFCAPNKPKHKLFIRYILALRFAFMRYDEALRSALSAIIINTVSHYFATLLITRVEHMADNVVEDYFSIHKFHIGSRRETPYFISLDMDGFTNYFPVISFPYINNVKELEAIFSTECKKMNEKKNKQTIIKQTKDEDQETFTITPVYHSSDCICRACRERDHRRFKI